MQNIERISDESLLVGLETSDDAAVYQLSEDQALIQTLDFFTPVVNDPYTFGQIAAANSLSDVYAMGGVPKLALNIVCFPNCLDPSILGEILLGGADKCKEAGVLVVGGHTVQDDEPKFGLSVTGFVHPDQVLKNANAKPGDQLILTKPIGTGVINTAIKGELIDEDSEHYHKAVSWMTTLNDRALQAMSGLSVHSCTDITGFGLGGHLFEMAEGSDVSIILRHQDIPVLEGAYENASLGVVPEGCYHNREHVGARYRWVVPKDEPMDDLLFDPQTSGGLLISIDAADASSYLEAIHKLGQSAWLVGEVTDRQEQYLIIE